MSLWWALLPVALGRVITLKRCTLGHIHRDQSSATPDRHWDFGRKLDPVDVSPSSSAIDQPLRPTFLLSAYSACPGSRGVREAPYSKPTKGPTNQGGRKNKNTDQSLDEGHMPSTQGGRTLQIPGRYSPSQGRQPWKLGRGHMACGRPY